MLREVEARGAATTKEIVAATGLHENTVRGHLERLVADGHLRRQQNPPAGRGRPSTSWHAVDPEITTPYAGLAVTLAAALADSGGDAPQRARAAGRAWGEKLASERTDDADARSLVFDMMREHGFAPENSGAAITLRSCPLLIAAEQGSAVVCAAHEGMVEGIARTRSERARASLQPFAYEGACILHVPVAS